MKQALGKINLLVLIGLLSACSVVRQVEELPVDNYSVPSRLFPSSGFDKGPKRKRVAATLELTDSLLHLTPLTSEFSPLSLNLQQHQNFRVYRRTFDLDVFTVPFKIRPSVKGFPEQLNPNFSAALYLGRRIDSYHFKPLRTIKSQTIISGLGVGYGGFVGIGSATMNPFVTQNHIAYEYEGFVVTGGLAGIYDAKKFNLGLALGFDSLVDKNRSYWLYQRKPWLGILFGINLN